DLELVKEISNEVPFRVILIRKDAKKTPTEDKTDQFLQTLNRSGFDILRPKISSNEFTDEWWKEVSSALRSTVMDCIQSSPAYPKTKKFNLMEEGINDKLLREISSHLNFPVTFQCGSYSSHDNYLTKAQKYVMSSSSKPLLITGSTGVGKSFLISQISKTCREWKPNTCVMTRFVGATENSTTIDGLIYYLVEQGLVTHGFPSNFDCLDMYSNLKAILNKASNSRPIILLLHGMDKLVNDKTSTSRFIDTLFELPENVKVILTATEGSAFQEEFSHKINDGESIIKILSQLLLTGTSEHKNCNSSLENEIEYFFKSLQDIFPKAILQTVLGCLALTRIGLLEKEILSIIELSHSPAVRSPILEWFYLRRLLKP
ncbi:NACHT and WD repeat domain-containing protein 2, partial [Armadillidium nasatum]